MIARERVFDSSGGRLHSRLALAALLFAASLHVAWIGAWLLERALEPHLVFLSTSGGRSAYWLIMKLILWIAPSIVLLRASAHTVRGVMGFGRVRAIVLWGGGTGLMLGLITISTKAFGQQPLFTSPLGWPLVSGVVVAPLVEEFTFRGAILGALITRYPFGLANGVTSMLFVGIHLPGWYFQGCLMENLSSPVGGALSIFLLGLLFGYVAHKSKSVAASTLCHSLNNLFNA